MHLPAVRLTQGITHKTGISETPSLLAYRARRILSLGDSVGHEVKVQGRC